MDYQQYFKETYPSVIPHEIIALDNAIYELCNRAFDYEGRCVDEKSCAIACKQIKYAYKLVGPFEERLKADINELEGNNGFSLFYDIDDMHRKAFYSMQTIIEEYHRYLPYIIEDKNEDMNLKPLSAEPQLLKTTDSLHSDASHKRNLPRPLACWLLKGSETESVTWSHFFKESVWEKLLKHVGQFQLPPKSTPLQTQKFISRLSVALIYKAAEQEELAKSFLANPGIGASIERTFKPFASHYRRQDMERYMNLLKIFILMEECKRSNNFNKRMCLHDENDNNTLANHKSLKRMEHQDIIENPEDLALELKEEAPDFYFILLHNYTQIGEILSWLRKKIKGRMPK